MERVEELPQHIADWVDGGIVVCIYCVCDMCIYYACDCALVLGIPIPSGSFPYGGVLTSSC